MSWGILLQNSARCQQLLLLKREVISLLADQDLSPGIPGLTPLRTSFLSSYNLISCPNGVKREVRPLAEFHSPYLQKHSACEDASPFINGILLPILESLHGRL
jgi:hypothetical protein